MAEGSAPRQGPSPIAEESGHPPLRGPLLRVPTPLLRRENSQYRRVLHSSLRREDTHDGGSSPTTEERGQSWLRGANPVAGERGHPLLRRVETFWLTDPKLITEEKGYPLLSDPNHNSEERGRPLLRGLSPAAGERDARL